MEQKNEKRQRTKLYSVVKAATGSWCPLWSQGCLVCLHPPCTDEPRIQLQVGDLVHVTRWRRHWLFGDKQPTQADLELKAKPAKVRGWFPRRCAIEVSEGQPHQDKKDK